MAAPVLDLAIRILKRREKLFAKQAPWYPTWRELGEHISPRKTNALLSRSKGQKQTVKLFDSTALDAATKLSSHMQGALTSAASRWFSLAYAKRELNEIKDARDWLEDCSIRIYQMYSESNFYSEIAEVYLDLDVFATACILQEEKGNPTDESSPFGGFQFRTMSIAEYAFAEDAEGYVDTVFRVFKLTARAMVDQFGKENVSAKVQTKYDSDPDEEFEIVHAVYPRPGISRNILGSVTGKNRPWASVYVESAAKNLLQETGFYTFPYAGPRWAKASGEEYGRGPGFDALPDVRTLNRSVEMKMRAWAKIIDPPLKVRDKGVIGQTQTGAAGQTSVRDMEAIRPLYEGVSERFNITNLEEEKLKTAIRAIFFIDQIQLRDGPMMTAEESRIRFELMQRILGPTLGRLQSELLGPIIDRSFDLSYRRGALSTPPDIVLKEGRRTIVRYENPLARAQRLGEVEAVQRYIGIMAPVEKEHPEVADNVDYDYLSRNTAEVVGIPSKAIRDERKVQDIRAKRAEEQKAVAEQQQQMEMAKAAGQMAPAIQAAKGAGGA